MYTAYNLLAGLTISDSSAKYPYYACQNSQDLLF